jgi:multidrug efflux pump subunit AcrB
MGLSHFFIDRPIFASVVSIVIILLGLVSYVTLPIAQYPEIAPPVINVTGQYPGANAQVVATTVVAPIEEQINGVEGMLYMSSNSTADGRFSISVTFDIGTDLDRPRCRSRTVSASRSRACRRKCAISACW